MRRRGARTVGRLGVADGRHGLQGRLQGELSVGDHGAEGGRLLCGDLHAQCINRRSRTQGRTHNDGHTDIETIRAHARKNKQDSTGKGTDDRETEDTC